MNEANYGKCRDLSVIWEFSNLSFLSSLSFYIFLIPPILIGRAHLYWSFMDIYLSILFKFVTLILLLLAFALHNCDSCVLIARAQLKCARTFTAI